ncbi:MAG: HEPN domain-containing protein [Firmicutes bacterium]|nr:HEPN domain-containing protein [Bacillota bacterium]
MSNDLTSVLIRVKMEKAREAMGEATWCFDGEKYPAAVNRLYYAIYRACLALLAGEDRIPVKHTAVIGLVNK